jgi:hypothetical protein
MGKVLKCKEESHCHQEYQADGNRHPANSLRFGRRGSRIGARAEKCKKLRQIDMSHYFVRNPASLIMRSNATLGPAASALEKEIMDSFITA